MYGWIIHALLTHGLKNWHFHAAQFLVPSSFFSLVQAPFLAFTLGHQDGGREEVELGKRDWGREKAQQGWGIIWNKSSSLFLRQALWEQATFDPLETVFYTQLTQKMVPFVSHVPMPRSHVPMSPSPSPTSPYTHSHFPGLASPSPAFQTRILLSPYPPPSPTFSDSLKWLLFVYDW